MTRLIQGGLHGERASVLEKDLTDLIDEVKGLDLVMVEIGSYAGESAEIFAQSGKFKLIVCVDPWITDPDGDGGNSYRDMDRVEREFDERTSKYPCIVKCKGTVDTFVELARRGEGVYSVIKAGGIDLAYIDGLHTYDGIKHDIKTLQANFLLKLAFSGHDYTDAFQHVRGVKKAVNEILGVPDKTFCYNSWIKFVK